jgi:hypothetical protein
MKIVGLTTVIACLLGSATACSGVSSVQDRKEASRNARAQAEYIIFTNIQSALMATGKSARIYVHDDACQEGELGYLLFPMMEIRTPTKGQKGVEAIRYMFSDDPNVEVTEDVSGIVRISVGKVSTELLGTKVHSLMFSQRAQYNPQLPGTDGSTDTIMDAQEVKAVMAKLKVSMIGGAFDILEAPPIETLPHLPSSMNDVTVEQALDTVAKTFGGIIRYEECREPSGEGRIGVRFCWIPKDEN